MNNSNWPSGINYGHQNYTGRFERVGSWNRAGGSYESGSERIPVAGWIGGALFIAAVFGFVPLLNWIVGGV